jgi:hypothetical protein
MAAIETNWQPTSKQLRQFAVLQVVFVVCLSLWLALMHGMPRLAAGLAAASVGLGAAGYVWTPLMRVVYVAWMAIVFPIGWLVSHVLLAIVFYLVFTPIGIIMKLCRYDPMRRKFDREADSYWQPREQDEDTSRYFKQY